VNSAPWYVDDYRAGIDLPPWWTAMPGFTPLGVAQWGGNLFHQQAAAPSSSFSSSSVPAASVVPWFGIAAVIGIGAVLIYGISRASTSSERFVGPIHKRAGKFAAGMVQRAYSGGSASGARGLVRSDGMKSFNNSSRSAPARKIVEAKFLPLYDAYK